MKKNIATVPLTPILKIMLNRYREDRAFDPKRYLDIKLNLLYQYFNLEYNDCLLYLPIEFKLNLEYNLDLYLI